MQNATVTGEYYFTQNHQWINFQGFQAYIGICKLFLKESQNLPQIQFSENGGCHMKGQTIATIYHDNHRIPFSMPVDGKIICINDALSQNDLELTSEYPEVKNWMALIEPSNPSDKEGLMQSGQYKQFCQSEILKQLNNAHNSGFFLMHIGSVV